LRRHRLAFRAFLLRLRWADGRSLEWIEREGDRETHYTTQPETGVMKRLWIQFLSILPIEWLL
jgi:cardiolipin synthase C